MVVVVNIGHKPHGQEDEALILTYPKQFSPSRVRNVCRHSKVFMLSFWKFDSESRRWIYRWCFGCALFIKFVDIKYCKILRRSKSLIKASTGYLLKSALMFDVLWIMYWLPFQSLYYLFSFLLEFFVNHKSNTKNKFKWKPFKSGSK